MPRWKLKFERKNRKRSWRIKRATEKTPDIQLLEAVVQRCSVKKVLLDIRKIHRKTPVPKTLF